MGKHITGKKLDGGYGPAPLEDFEKQLLQDDDDGKIITMEMNDKGEMVPVNDD